MSLRKSLSLVLALLMVLATCNLQMAFAEDPLAIEFYDADADGVVLDFNQGLAVAETNVDDISLTLGGEEVDFTVSWHNSNTVIRLDTEMQFDQTYTLTVPAGFGYGTVTLAEAFTKTFQVEKLYEQDFEADTLPAEWNVGVFKTHIVDDGDGKAAYYAQLSMQDLSEAMGEDMLELSDYTFAFDVQYYNNDWEGDGPADQNIEDSIVLRSDGIYSPYEPYGAKGNNYRFWLTKDNVKLQKVTGGSPADCTYSDGSSTNIGYRWFSDTNLDSSYCLEMGVNNWKENNPGNGFQIQTTPATYRMKVAARGNNLKYYKDDVIGINYTDEDAPYLKGGFSYISGYARAVVLDDFIITRAVEVAESDKDPITVTSCEESTEQIAVTFSGAIDGADTSGITVTADSTPLTVSSTASGNTLTITTDGGFAYGVEYALTIPKGFGNDTVELAEPYTKTFTLTQPVEGNMEVDSYNADLDGVVIDFSAETLDAEAMAANATQITLEKDGAPVTVTASMLDSNTLWLAADMELDTRYSLTVPAGFGDGQNVTAEAYIRNFTIEQVFADTFEEPWEGKDNPNWKYGYQALLQYYDDNGDGKMASFYTEGEILHPSPNLISDVEQMAQTDYTISYDVEYYTQRGNPSNTANISQIVLRSPNAKASVAGYMKEDTPGYKIRIAADYAQLDKGAEQNYKNTRKNLSEVLDGSELNGYNLSLGTNASTAAEGHDFAKPSDTAQQGKLYNMKASIRGNTIKFYINNKLAIDVVDDTDPYTAGYFGLQDIEAYNLLDNVMVTKVVEEYVAPTELNALSYTANAEKVTVTFDQDISAVTDFANAGIYQGADKVDATYTADGNVLTITPAENLDFGVAYDVVIATGFGIGDMVTDTEYKQTFTLEAPPSEGLAVESINGDLNNIYVTFDQDITNASGTIELSKGGEAVSITTSINENVLTISPQGGLESGAVYEVFIGKGYGIADYGLGSNYLQQVKMTNLFTDDFSADPWDRELTDGDGKPTDFWTARGNNGPIVPFGNWNKIGYGRHWGWTSEIEERYENSEQVKDKMWLTWMSTGMVYPVTVSQNADGSEVRTPIVEDSYTLEYKDQMYVTNGNGAKKGNIVLLSTPTSSDKASRYQICFGYEEGNKVTLEKVIDGVHHDTVDNNSQHTDAKGPAAILATADMPEIIPGASNTGNNTDKAGPEGQDDSNGLRATSEAPTEDVKVQVDRLSDGSVSIKFWYGDTTGEPLLEGIDSDSPLGSGTVGFTNIENGTWVIDDVKLYQFELLDNELVVNATVTDASGNPITDWSNATALKGEVSVKNYTDEEKPVQMIVGVFSADNQLLRASVLVDSNAADELTIGGGEIQNYAFSFDGLPTGAKELRVFMWDSFESLTPYGVPLLYPQNE